MWFQRRRYASTAQRPSSLSEHVNTRYGRQDKRAVSWKRGVVAEPFHARLIKPITPSLSDPRDVSRPTHHVSLFSFSSCFFCPPFPALLPVPRTYFGFAPLPRLSLHSWCCPYLPHQSPLSLSLSLQCHQPGCRSADNPAARSALIRDKRCFLSAPAVGLGPGWDEALPWPGNPRPAAGSGLLTNGSFAGIQTQIRQQRLSRHWLVPQCHKCVNMTMC